MALLLAIALTLCAVCIMILQARNNQLHHRVEAYKSLHTQLLKQTREWESKYFDARTEVSDLTVKLQNATEVLDVAEEGEALPPPSHDVPTVDVEAAMSDSVDPIWNLVGECRRAGLVEDWLAECRPDLSHAQPHRKYSEFATFILQLPEHQQNADGVKLAVSGRV